MEIEKSNVMLKFSLLKLLTHESQQLTLTAKFVKYVKKITQTADSTTDTKISLDTCHVSRVTCHLTITLCSFSCCESFRILGDAAEGGLVIDRGKEKSAQMLFKEIKDEPL